MVCCEQILKDLALHEDSWPFRQAVNLREVGCLMMVVSYHSSLRAALFRNIVTITLLSLLPYCHYCPLSRYCHYYPLL